MAVEEFSLCLNHNHHMYSDRAMRKIQDKIIMYGALQT